MLQAAAGRYKGNQRLTKPYQPLRCNTTIHHPFRGGVRRALSAVTPRARWRVLVVRIAPPTLWHLSFRRLRRTAPRALRRLVVLRTVPLALWRLIGVLPSALRRLIGVSLTPSARRLSVNCSGYEKRNQNHDRFQHNCLLGAEKRRRISVAGCFALTAKMDGASAIPFKMPYACATTNHTAAMATKDIARASRTHSMSLSLTKPSTEKLVGGTG